MPMLDLIMMSWNLWIPNIYQSTDPDERREVLEDAGLDPDEFDFSN